MPKDQNAFDVLAKQFKLIGQALAKKDYVTAGDLAHSGAHMAESEAEKTEEKWTQP